MENKGLVIDAITKEFGGVTVLDALDFDIAPGEIVAITGPSGVGKTTMCRVVSGIEFPTTGRVVVAGEDITGQPASKRGVAHMFESYALYPHMNVAQNVAFPLRAPARRLRRRHGHIEKAVEDILSLTQIAHLGHRHPSELSGGQKQRVALCRALVQDATCYVLDEPISHLDAKLRNELRGAIRRRLSTKPAPTLWSTPDAMEALSIADRAAVLIDGKIHQFAPPEDIYFKPATTAVARLVGDPAMNLLKGRFELDGDTAEFKGHGMSVILPKDFAQRIIKAAKSSEVVLGIRPNGIEIVDDASRGSGGNFQVYAWEPFGKYGIVTAQAGHQFLRIKTPGVERFEIGQMIAVDLDPSAITVFEDDMRLTV